MSKKNSHSQTSTLDTSAIQKLVEEAQASLGSVGRLSPIERKRALKLKRGAHQVLPLIASIARKYSVQAPGASVDDMESNIAYAQSLEPVLGAVGVLQGTLSDAHLSAQSSAWMTGTVSYSMLKKASKANVSIANELAPVTEWFRQNHVSKKKLDAKKAATTAETPPAEAAEAQATPVAPAAKPNGVTAPVTTPTSTTAAASS